MAATRLSVRQEQDYTHLVDNVDDLDALPLTLRQAHLLSPPRCHLAPLDDPAQLARYNALMATQAASLPDDGSSANVAPLLTTSTAQTAWTGMYKEISAAYNDRLSDSKVRRGKWTSFAGQLLPSTDTTLWNAGQPSKVVSSDTADILHVLGVVNGKLTALSPTESLDGAFYQCCAVYAFEVDENQGGNFEENLLSLIAMQS